jgi:sulfide:quinone oxidoreductase
MGMDRVVLHIVTPERTPLGIFGPKASASVADLLDAADIVMHRGVVADVNADGAIELGFGEPLHVDRIVALPALGGPALDGVPSDARGFIPVDELCRVRGLEHVRAAGDATDQPVKQGGLACQQADVVATGIAAAAGADVTVEPMHAVLNGLLLTGHRDRFLRRAVGEHDSETALEPLWWPPTKVHSRYLAPYLERHGLTEVPMRRLDTDLDIDVRIPLGAGS